MSIYPSVSPSVGMEQLGFHWPDFQEILYFSIFRKSVEEIQVSLKYNKKVGRWAGVENFSKICKL
jgi:hypothetical protein